MVITSLLRSEGPRFEPGWNHFYARYNAYTAPFCALLLPTHHDYPFLTLSSVGSYQVGYTRSHPNTEVKMLRACSVPLCSHRWERQVIYLFLFFNTTLLYNTLQYNTLLYNFIPLIPIPLYSTTMLLLPIPLSPPLTLLPFLFIYIKRRAWQGSNLQSSDS